MNMASLSGLNLDEIQLLALAAANAAAAAQQHQQQQSHRGMQQHSSPHHQQQQHLHHLTSAATITPVNKNSGSRSSTPMQNGISSNSISISSTSSPSSSMINPLLPASAVASMSLSMDAQSQSKYQQLLSVIEEMSKDIRPTYAGSKSSAERLKRGIVYARILVRECLVETERSART